MSGVLMGNNLGTIHNAVADYSPDESRQIHRCPTMTSRFLMQTVHPKHAKKRALMQEISGRSPSGPFSGQDLIAGFDAVAFDQIGIFIALESHRGGQGRQFGDLGHQALFLQL